MTSMTTMASGERYEPARIIGGETEEQAEGLLFERDEEAHRNNGLLSGKAGQARQQQSFTGLIRLTTPRSMQ